MATASANIRLVLDAREATTAPTTSARLQPGTAPINRSIPIPAFWMEGSTSSLVTDNAATIRTSAPRRSNHRARLNVSHQMTMARPQRMPPTMPMSPTETSAISAFGAMAGSAYARAHCRMTRMMPGLTRRGVLSMSGQYVGRCSVRSVEDQRRAIHAATSALQCSRFWISILRNSVGAVSD